MIRKITMAILMALAGNAVATPPAKVTVPLFPAAMSLRLKGSAPIYRDADDKSPKLQWTLLSPGWFNPSLVYHWPGEAPEGKTETGEEKIVEGNYPLIAYDEGQWYKTYHADREGWLYISGDVKTVAREPVKVNDEGYFRVETPYAKQDAHVFVRQSGKYAGYSAFIYQADTFTGICVGSIIDGIGVYPLLLPCKVESALHGTYLNRPKTGSNVWALGLYDRNLNALPDEMFEQILQNALGSEDILVAFRFGNGNRMVEFNASKASPDLQTVTVPFCPATDVLPEVKVKKVDTPESIRNAELKALERTVSRPKVKSINPGVVVESVTLSRNYTKMTLSFTKTGNGPWNVNCYAAITSNVTGDKEFMIRSVTGAEMSPKPTHSRNGEKVVFTMTFAPVPTDATLITLNEGPSRDNFHAVDVEVPLQEKTGSSTGEQVITGPNREPEYPGGLGALMKDLSAALVYPPMAQEKKITGKVMVRLMVDREGNLVDCQVIKSVSPELDAAALAAVRKLRKMNPAIRNGKAVEGSFTLPVTFSLH